MKKLVCGLVALSLLVVVQSVQANGGFFSQIARNAGQRQAFRQQLRLGNHAVVQQQVVVAHQRVYAQPIYQQQLVQRVYAQPIVYQQQIAQPVYTQQYVQPQAIQGCGGQAVYQQQLNQGSCGQFFQPQQFRNY